jgi:hypothetical protein
VIIFLVPALINAFIIFNLVYLIFFEKIIKKFGKRFGLKIKEVDIYKISRYWKFVKKEILKKNRPL